MYSSTSKDTRCVNCGVRNCNAYYGRIENCMCYQCYYGDYVVSDYMPLKVQKEHKKRIEEYNTKKMIEKYKAGKMIEKYKAGKMIEKHSLLIINICGIFS